MCNQKPVTNKTYKRNTLKQLSSCLNRTPACGSLSQGRKQIFPFVWASVSSEGESCTPNNRKHQNDLTMNGGAVHVTSGINTRGSWQDVSFPPSSLLMQKLKDVFWLFWKLCHFFMTTKPRECRFLLVRYLGLQRKNMILYISVTIHVS